MSRSWRTRPHISRRWLTWNYRKSNDRQKIKHMDDIQNGSSYKKIMSKHDTW